MLLRQHYCGRAYAWGWCKRVAGQPQQFLPDKAIPLPPGTVPAIVSEELWEAVQARIATNRQRSSRNAKNPESALLRGGYITCGSCGRNVQARPRTNGSVEYLCSKSRRNNDCPGCFIPAHTLDAAVWGKVSAVLKDPQVIAIELERLRKVDPTGDDLRAVDRALTELERQQGNLLNAIRLIEDSDSLSVLTSQLTTMRSQRSALLIDREQLLVRQQTWSSTQSSITQLASWCKTIGTRVDDMSWAEKRVTLDALGVHITLFPHTKNPRFVITADLPIEPVLDTTSGIRAWPCSACSAWPG
jgi:site-specific DNA recombinase